MTGLLNAELIKLRTTRTALGFAGISLLLVVAIVTLVSLLDDPTTTEDKRSAIESSGLISTILIIFGVVGATGEHRHGTITSTFLIVPDRVRATLAKLIAYAAAGALFAVGIQVVAAALGLGLMSGDPGAAPSVGDLLELAGVGALASALSAALGVAVGALVRNQVAAVVGTLAWLFILESALIGLVPSVGKFSVSGATTSLLQSMEMDDGLAQGAGGLVLLAWVVLLGTAAVLADRARDVT